MSTGPDLFLPTPSDASDVAQAVQQALTCLDAFTACFNAGDLAGMDARLHFPHIILSDAQMLVWEGPGQLPMDFFDRLRTDTGFHHSRYLAREVLLASASKVHLRVVYTRERADNTVISRHDNLWIVTCAAGRWAIQLRSY